MSQTHIFNFFPGLMHSNRILKTLSLFASGQKNGYLPNPQVWLNKLYFQISNSKKKTSADNGEEQTCYFNRNKSDTHFTCFSAKRTQAEPITFSIVKLNSDFELVNKSLEFELKNSVSNGQLNRQLQQVSSEDFNNGKFNRLQSQPMYDSDNMEDLEATLEEESIQQLLPEKTPRYLFYV